MRRVVLMVALALALPAVAFASSIIDYTNAIGTISASSSGLSVNSTLALISVPGGSILAAGDLGTVSITAGALISGTVDAGGVFGPGTLTITSKGGAVLFSGTFDSATWCGPSTGCGTGIGSSIEYVLHIDFKGNQGTSTQIALFTTGPFTGQGMIASGDTTVLVPEPGTMGLLGTGLVGIAGLVRRKLKV